MANECRHRLTIKGDPAEVEHLFAEIRGLPGAPNELMDLNSIIPAPKSIRRLLKLGLLDIVREAVEDEAAFAAYERKQQAARSAAWLETGCETWGEWAQAAWGSMSNVFNVEYAEDEPSTILFSTVWVPVIPALIELSAIVPTVTLKLAFADAGGYIVGKGTIRAGKKRVSKCPIGTREGRQIFESFWGQWFGPEPDSDKVDEVIDQTHKTAS